MNKQMKALKNQNNMVYNILRILVHVGSYARLRRSNLFMIDLSARAVTLDTMIWVPLYTPLVTDTFRRS